MLSDYSDDTESTGSEPKENDYCFIDKSTYTYIDGRKYNKKYELPADDEEVTREQLQHYLMRFVWQTNFSAPVDKLLKESSNVLDVGCGPGTWLLEMASEYPESKFMGIDISDVFPTECMPRNADFQTADILESLPFNDNTYDFVFMRFLITAIPEDKWTSQVIPELIRVTKPGGWIELMESDCKLVNEGPNTKKLTDAIMIALKSRNINGNAGNLLPGFLGSSTGIDKSSITHETNGGPIGNWGGKAGVLSIDTSCISFRSLKSLVMRYNPDVEENYFYNLVDSYSKEVEEYETSWKTHRVFARKDLKAN
ncbi:7847_t:CDS:2 [Funneliformis mosseae]|uniref:7847_t:CDS:1 n=1 Tax=Funneliformis mosseae TaxID=27381 RepID=A0A9N9B1J0_FUNMO|nr:7847_t:CDS:2 [Funneliformis mosseae]